MYKVLLKRKREETPGYYWESHDGRYFEAESKNEGFLLKEAKPVSIRKNAEAPESIKAHLNALIKSRSATPSQINQFIDDNNIKRNEIEYKKPEQVIGTEILEGVNQVKEKIVEALEKDQWYNPVSYEKKEQDIGRMTHIMSLSINKSKAWEKIEKSARKIRDPANPKNVFHNLAIFDSDMDDAKVKAVFNFMVSPEDLNWERLAKKTFMAESTTGHRIWDEYGNGDSKPKDIDDFSQAAYSARQDLAVTAEKNKEKHDQVAKDIKRAIKEDREKSHQAKPDDYEV